MSKITPLVSIMMPAKNESTYIGSAIDSVLEQSYSNWELIIVDDKSTDDTRAIAEVYAHNDPRIRVVEGDGICSGNARNLAVRLAKGQFIMNMDADDVAAPNRIEELLKVALKHPRVVVGSGAAMVNEKLEPKRIVLKPESNREIRRAFRRRWNRAAIMPQTMLVTADLLREYPYNEFYLVMVDWDLILRLSEDESIVFANVRSPLYKYRLNPGSMTLQQSKRIKFNLMLRYNERRRKNAVPEVKSLDEFETSLRYRPIDRMVYFGLFGLKRIQHSYLLMKYRFLFDGKFR